MKTSAQAGEPLSFSVEEQKLPSPANKQALVRFLAAAVSPSDYRVMTAAGDPAKGGVREVRGRQWLREYVCTCIRMVV